MCSVFHYPILQISLIFTLSYYNVFFVFHCLCKLKLHDYTQNINCFTYKNIFNFNIFYANYVPSSLVSILRYSLLGLQYVT